MGTGGYLFIKVYIYVRDTQEKLTGIYDVWIYTGAKKKNGRLRDGKTERGGCKRRSGQRALCFIVPVESEGINSLDAMGPCWVAAGWNGGGEGEGHNSVACAIKFSGLQ